VNTPAYTVPKLDYAQHDRSLQTECRSPVIVPAPLNKEGEYVKDIAIMCKSILGVHPSCMHPAFRSLP
jgi:hypothetical protein